jgi:hypothetical protein
MSRGPCAKVLTIFLFRGIRVPTTTDVKLQGARDTNPPNHYSRNAVPASLAEGNGCWFLLNLATQACVLGYQRTGSAYEVHASGVIKL